ncbi:MAG TPA: hypothetical protein VLF09_03180 [Cellvibrio sp.]|nr:hypothetical protein [Cellvibrio sp.]
MLIYGMQGLGDNIYQRAFIKQLPQPLFIQTPWPELYSDLRANFVMPATRLRTQTKNINRNDCWISASSAQKILRIGYGDEGIYTGMRRSFGIEPGELDLPDFGESPVQGKYAVIRPVSVRAEWRADSRNPEPEHVNACADILRARGYTVVSVADFKDGEEWPVGDLPDTDQQFHAGELSVSELMALIQNAAVVVGGIGWIVPASIAAKTPAWIVCGGQGGFNHPHLITDVTMDLTRIHFAMPENYCRCKERQHNCNKWIENHDERFAKWLNRLPALV